MYDMHYDPNDEDKNEVLQYVKNNGVNGIVYIEYQYNQIGLDNEWLKEMYNKINDPLVVKREILLQRLRGSSDSPFDQEDIEYIVSCIRDVKEELYILEHFRFDLYAEINKNKPYLVSIDCSTGTNGDNNAITIIDPYSTEPVGEFKCPYIGETQFEQVIMELIRKHIPRGIVIIERNSVGDGIIDFLLNSPIRSNLYYDKDRDLVEDTMKSNQTVTSMLKKQAEMKKYYGVYTGTKSREDMMAILFRRVAEYKDLFVTKNITDDLSKLVRTRSGKIEAGPGAHDDSIMSYLIGMYVYYHGNNLPMFGFIKGSEEIKDQNQGLDKTTYDDLKFSGIIPEKDIETMKIQEMVRQENDYEAMMRRAIAKSQQESMLLQKKGLVSNTVLQNTPDMLLNNDLYPMFNDDDEDLSFFDEMNNM